MTKTVTISPECEMPSQNDDTPVDPVEEIVNTDDDDYESEASDIFEPQMDLGQLLSNFFVTESGVNVADAIMELKESLDIHNKLLHKYIKAKLDK